MRDVIRARRYMVILLVGMVIVAGFMGMVGTTYGHSGDVINAPWTANPPTIDGNFPAGEWDDAVKIDLSVISGNTFDAYMYVMNDGGFLYIAFDATGDTTQDAMDGASFCFDTDHNGLETDGEDDQFYVGDPFGTNSPDYQSHYNYSVADGMWMAHCKPFDDGTLYPDHAGLAGEWGFGPSPDSGTDHRIYEIAIPLALLGILPGDTIGFAGNGQQAPMILDNSIGQWDSWPDNPMGPHLLPDYGDIVLDTPPDPIDVRLTPEQDLGWGNAGDEVAYDMTVKNRGTAGPDSFDLNYSGFLGWLAEFYDSTGTVLLTDTNGDVNGLPDTGDIPSGESLDIVVKITVSFFALPGDWELTTVNASSFADPNVYDTSDLNTRVPFEILVVDDDDGLTSDLWYTNSITAVGYSYDYWDTSLDSSPSQNTLDSHTVVIWFTGNNNWGDTLTSYDREILGNYLDSGGKLFVSSQYLGDDAYWGPSPWPDWYEQYLDVRFDGGLGGSRDHYGVPGNPVGNGLVLETYEGDYCAALNGNANRLEPQMYADPAFNVTWAGINDTAVTTEKGAYRLIYFGFDFAGINDTVPGQRDTVMQRILDWLMPPWGVSIYNDQVKMTGAGTVVSYGLTVKNIGTTGADSFDLTNTTAPLGWDVAYYDSTGTVLLTDTNGDINGYPDTGPVDSLSAVDIVVKVTVPPTANPGDYDVATITATSFNAPAESSDVILETHVLAPILVVDDDSDIDSELWYTNALAANAYAYNVWNYTIWGTPSLGTMQQYDIVIWFTGNDGTGGIGKTLKQSDRDVLGPYLDGGGKLFFSSQHAGEDSFMAFPAWNTWYETYFDASYTWNTYGSPQTVTGIAGNPVGDSLVFDTGVLDACLSLNHNLETINYMAPADPAFNISQASPNYTAVTIDEMNYRAVYFSFDFASIGGVVNRDIVMDRIINWLSPAYDLSLYPDNSSFGDPGQAVSYDTTVRNIGNNPDSFDLTNSAMPPGWIVEFYDSTGTVLLADTNGDVNGYPDTGVVNSGDTFDFVIKVTISLTAAEGSTEYTDVTATSFNDPTKDDTITLATGVIAIGPWFDDMESGTNSWLYDGFWHQVDEADVLAPAWNISNSWSHSWWYGQDATGDYDNGVRNWGYLTSPAINLTRFIRAELDFFNWYETEFGTTWDQRWVEIKAGNGPWQSITQLDSSVEPMSQWNFYNFDLSPYMPNVVQVRFFFDTMDEISNNLQGWYIDDAGLNATLVTIEPFYQTQTSFPGATASYTLTVYNWGVTADSFDLTNTSAPQGWDVSFWDSSGTVLLTDTNGDVNSYPDTDTVPSGGSVDIIVKVDIPGGASPGQYDNATITATSFVNNTFSDVCYVNTTTVQEPPTVTNMRLTGATFDNIEITWDRSPHDGIGLDDVVEYRIYREENGGGYALYDTVLATDSPSYTWNDPGTNEGDNSTFYNYTICAFNGVAESMYTPAHGKTTKYIEDGQWKLISFPIVQYDNTRPTVFQTLENVQEIQTYDPWDGTGDWKTYSASKPSHMNDLDTFMSGPTFEAHKYGYWVKIVGGDDVLVVVGKLCPSDVLAERNINLRGGSWNLVGYPSFTPETVGNAMSGLGANYKVKDYDSGSPHRLKNLPDASMMYPGQGYWIWVDTDCVWTVDW